MADDSSSVLPIHLLDEINSLENELQKVVKELEDTKKQLKEELDLKLKSEKYNAELRLEVEKLNCLLRLCKTTNTSYEEQVDAETQVDDQILAADLAYDYYAHGPVYDYDQTEYTSNQSTVAPWSTDVLEEESPLPPEEGEVKEEPQSIADSLKEAAESAMQQSGYVYDEKSGLYYDHKSGYYYDSERQLYYEPNSGTYYYFEPESKTYQFHSQVDLSAYNICLPQSEQTQEDKSPHKRKKKHKHSHDRKKKRRHHSHSEQEEDGHHHHSERKRSKRRRNKKEEETTLDSDHSKGQVKKDEEIIGEKKKSHKHKHKKKKKIEVEPPIVTYCAKATSYSSDINSRRVVLPALGGSNDKNTVSDVKRVDERLLKESIIDKTCNIVGQGSNSVNEISSIHKHETSENIFDSDTEAEKWIEDPSSESQTSSVQIGPKLEDYIHYLKPSETSNETLENESSNNLIEHVEQTDALANYNTDLTENTDNIGGNLQNALKENVYSENIPINESKLESTKDTHLPVTETLKDSSKDVTVDSSECDSENPNVQILEIKDDTDQNETVFEKQNITSYTENLKKIEEILTDKEMVMSARVEGSIVDQKSLKHSDSGISESTEMEEPDLESTDGEKRDSTTLSKPKILNDETVSTGKMNEQLSSSASEESDHKEMNANILNDNEMKIVSVSGSISASMSVKSDHKELTTDSLNDNEIKNKEEILNKVSISTDDNDMEEGEITDDSETKEKNESRESHSEDDMYSSFTSSGSESDTFEEEQPASAVHWPPCIRVMVKVSDTLNVGSLYIITCSGATIGREQSLGHAIVIPDPLVSKMHCSIMYNEDMKTYLMKDHATENGTFLNDQRLCKKKKMSDHFALQHGDTLRLGGSEFDLHIHQGTDTCQQCEPGQVQVSLSSTNPEPITLVTKAEKEKLRKKELKQIKKKYGLQNEAFIDRDGNHQSNYTDKAAERRRKVGSDHPYQKDDAPASVHVAISSENKGHKLLAKMGWKEGESLGKSIEGIKEPIQVGLRVNKSAGLGSSSGISHSLDNVHTVRNTERWLKTQQRFQQIDKKEQLTDQAVSSDKHKQTKPAISKLQWVKGETIEASNTTEDPD